MDSPGDRVAAVVVTVWLHGDDVVGRITRVPREKFAPEPGSTYHSAEAICAAVRAFLDEVAACPAD